ncbi:MAG: DUF2784 domain-containing protein [Burkholderiales bacterium]|nr:MAG: DUF2784 domain-containing protein [Burkholderiales bacterium]
MLARMLADAVLAFHGIFILFAVFGGLWVNWRQPIRKPRLIAHLACAAWAATVVIMGYTCPLTPLEQQLRIAAGQQGYQTSFIEHYLLSAIYPDGLTRPIQIALGLCVVVINALAYGVPWFLRRKRALALKQSE